MATNTYPPNTMFQTYLLSAIKNKYDYIVKNPHNCLHLFISGNNTFEISNYSQIEFIPKGSWHLNGTNIVFFGKDNDGFFNQKEIRCTDFEIVI